MAHVDKRKRAEWGLLVAGLAFAVGVLTLVWPTWIETLTGTDPDEGSGSLEVFVVVALFVVALVLGGFSALAIRRRSLADGSG